MTDRKNHNHSTKPLIPLEIWDILYPLLLYYAVTVIVMFCAKLVFGTDESQYMLCQITVGIVTLPVMYVSFYKPDKLVWGHEYLCPFPSENREKVMNLIWILLISLTLGTGLNNVILMSPLAGASAGFAEANANFYGSTLLPELIGSGILTPALEELTYRGVLYSRLRRYFGIPAAILLSALLFALMHFNLVQFIYALVLGVVFALLIERSGSVLGTFVSHMAVNLLAVLRTELGWLNATADGSAFAWGISLLLLMAGMCLLLTFLKPVNFIKKNAHKTKNNPKS